MKELYHNITKCILNIHTLKELVEVSDSGDFISMSIEGSPHLKAIPSEELSSVIREWRDDNPEGIEFQVDLSKYKDRPLEYIMKAHDEKGKLTSCITFEI